MQFLALILPLLPHLGPVTGAAKGEHPPGLVLIPGGPTKVGSTQKDIERLVEQFPALQTNFGSLSGETPQLTVEVDDFFLMVTEVTNEQFVAYVRATGARPPQLWAAEAINAAREGFLAAEAGRRAEAKAANQPVPKSAVFIERDWWLKNWRDKPWKIPEGLECRPVVYVDFEDALGYARWAGLRLMTEEEYQRAVRGDKDRSYPWGEHWEDGKYAATNEISKNNSAFAVGSFPAGASEQGVFDLTGNVWEWTASEYTRYAGFKPFKITIGHGDNKVTVDTPPDFNAEHRVAVGGSFENARHAARSTIRRGTARDQQAFAVGFRCAASIQPGRDVADALLREIPLARRPQRVDGAGSYDPKLTLALDRWQSEPGACKVPGYAVISSYEYILFTAVPEVSHATLPDARAGSLAQPLPIGFLATNQPLIEPKLAPGTYLVAFRGKGAAQQAKEIKRSGRRGAGKQAQPTLEGQLRFAHDVDNFILYDLGGQPVAAIQVDDADIGSAEPGSISIVDHDGKTPSGESTADTNRASLEIDVAVPAKGRNSFKGTLRMRFAPGVLEKDWRR